MIIIVISFVLVLIVIVVLEDTKSKLIKPLIFHLIHTFLYASHTHDICHAANSGPTKLGLPSIVDKKE